MTTATLSTTPSTTPSTPSTVLPFGLLNHKDLPTAADKQVAAKAALAEQIAAGAKLVQERLEAREAAAAAVATEVTALVEAIGSTYGKHIAFADAMTLHYAGWHLLSAGDKTETGLAVRAVKDNLFAQLKLVKHDCNPSQVWAKCKVYAVRATTPEAVCGSAPEQSEQDAEKPETEKKSIEVKIIFLPANSFLNLENSIKLSKLLWTLDSISSLIDDILT